jgi:glucosamine 6-phosphate synthetase-like amidotransferase/phosphosugar isomerase protein
MPPGELERGPVALIDKNLPVIVIAPSDYVRKTMSNLQEVGDCRIVRTVWEERRWASRGGLWQSRG